MVGPGGLAFFVPLAGLAVATGFARAAGVEASAVDAGFVLGVTPDEVAAATGLSFDVTCPGEALAASKGLALGVTGEALAASTGFDFAAGAGAAIVCGRAGASAAVRTPVGERSLVMEPRFGI
jgi:hypothetical protein